MKKENLEEFTYDAVLDLILSHHFQPGEFLLETEITTLLNLKSRTPVHHALGQLAAMGFLDRRNKRGYFIPLPTPEDAEQVYIVRENIASQSAMSAAFHASDEEIRELELIIEKEADIRMTGDIIAYSSINENFHSCIARISRNRYLQQFSKQIFWRSNLYVFFFQYKFKLGKKGDLQKDSPLQHRKILEAIKDRTPETAGELMAEHVRCTYNSIWE